MNDNKNDPPLKMYTVSWNIEILASSHREAAEEALDSIMIGTARVFEVTDTVTEKLKLIDLEENHDDGE
jgi:hypothetical protein